MTDWARRLLLTLWRWLPGRTIVAVMGGEFAALELLHALRPHMVVITRLRRDARLFDPPGEWDRRGRPAVKGDRQPTLLARTTDPATRWRRVVQASRAAWQRGLDRIHLRHSAPAPSRQADRADPAGGAAQGSARMARGMAAEGLVRYPDGKREPEAFLCTTAARPREVLGLFSRRWSRETTCEESRAHLGVETQRQRSDPAIFRTTPLLLGLYSVVALYAHQNAGRLALSPR